MDSTTTLKYEQQQAMMQQFYGYRTGATNGTYVTNKISQAYGLNLAQLNQEQEPNLLILLCDEAKEEDI